MRIAEGEIKIRALFLSAIADADNFEGFRKARGNADDHIMNKSTIKPVHRAVDFIIRRTGDGENAVNNRDRQIFMNSLRELTFWAFDGNGRVNDRDGNAVRDRDRSATNT